MRFRVKHILLSAVLGFTLHGLYKNQTIVSIVGTVQSVSTGTTVSKSEGTTASKSEGTTASISADTAESNKSEDNAKSESKAKFEHGNIKSHVDEQVPSSVTEELSLLHVISPYEVKGCESTFCPFNQEQSVTIGSMHRAKGAMNQGSVILAASALQSDIDIAVLAGLQALPALTRSSASEYPAMKPQKYFPFFQDIVDAVHRSAFDFEYLVYTNADIILDVNFYNKIQNLIAKNKYDFFTIKRRTVHERPRYTVENLDEIFTSKYKDHPGHDCFIIKHDILQHLQLGNVLIGTNIFPNLLLLHLKYHSTRFTQFSSSDVQATYHLGDARVWQDIKNPYVHQGIIEGICENEFVRALCYAELKTGIECKDMSWNERNSCYAELETNIECVHLMRKVDKFMKVKQFDFSNASCRELQEVKQRHIGELNPIQEQDDHHPPSKLLPPFNIVQIGAPRTGSTFQYLLLESIARLKSPPGTSVEMDYIDKGDWKGNNTKKMLRETESFVLKTHTPDPSLKSLQEEGVISVFSSSDIVPYSILTQNRDKLEECSACEIERYKPIFDLSDDDVTALKQHMHDFEILRQCCGLQMSKYEILRLHGCDVTKYMGQSDYPDCESKDLSAVENSFANSPIPFHPNNPEYNWANPGDCAWFNTEITSGKGFNGRPFDSCKIDGNFFGKAPDAKTISAQYPYIARNLITECGLANHSFATIGKRYRTKLPPLNHSLGFIKPHKTGSSTISNIVNRIVDGRHLNKIIPVNNMHLRNFEPVLLYNVDNVMKVTKYDAIDNHAIFNSTTFRRYLKDPMVVFTILREPVSRAVSAYNFFYRVRKFDSWRKHINFHKSQKAILGVEHLFTNNIAHSLGWYERNSMSTQNDKNKTAIQNFIKEVEKDLDHVMILEDLVESLVLLRDEVPGLDITELVWYDQKTTIKDPNYKKTCPTEMERRELTDFLLVDTMIYNHFRSKLQSKWKNQMAKSPVKSKELKDGLTCLHDKISGKTKVSEKLMKIMNTDSIDYTKVLRKKQDKRFGKKSIN